MSAAVLAKPRYRCVYVSPGGIEYKEGTFVEERRTQKAITLRMTEPGRFSMYPNATVRRIPIEPAKGSPFSRAVRHWGDGSFTVYHNQMGTPFVYEPISGTQAV